jgi:hypothetical protein
MKLNRIGVGLAAAVVFSFAWSAALAQDPAPPTSPVAPAAPAGFTSFARLAGGPKLILEDDFEHGAFLWKPTVESSWRISEDGGSQVYSQFVHSTAYQPPYRSPHNISLIKEVTVGDFELTVRVRTTKEFYDHRSACVFFGYQDPAHFYYVHFGQTMDDHANQVFIVDGAERLKISTKTTDGTPWDESWHNIKITRNAESGEIAVHFDDMETPIMTAVDRKFVWGQVGLGSFDDTANWDDFRLVATLAQKPPTEP